MEVSFEHLEVVETCAPLGIHVMVKKPMAVSIQHAIKMKSLAVKNNIHLLTNYETAQYASNPKTYKMVHKGDIGDLRKIVVRVDISIATIVLIFATDAMKMKKRSWKS